MKRITFFILSILCLTACNNEVEIEKPQPPGAQIELIFPDVEEVKVYSTATESECKIDKIWVLEFNSSGALVNSQLIDGSLIVKNGQAAQLMPQLNFAPTTNNTIVCIANSGINSGPLPTVTMSTINTVFSLTAKHFYVGGDYLPMYGSFEWISNNYTCKMTRAVAKIQIQMGTSVSDATGMFDIKDIEYEVYNSGYNGHIQPITGVVQGYAHTATHFTANSFNIIQKAGATEAKTNVYIYEFPSSIRSGIGAGGIGASITNNKTFDKNRQHIILFNNLDKTFYRLDFYNNKDSTFFDTKRNHHYLFTINKIRSKGYVSYSAAQDNPGSNIEYTIKIEDGSKSITSNGQYAIVISADTIKVPVGRALSDSLIATARYQLPTEMPTLTTSINTVAIFGYDGGTMTLGASSITTLPNVNGNISINVPNTFVKGNITINLGNIEKKIVVIAE